MQIGITHARTHTHTHTHTHRGDSVTMQKGEVSASVWQDRKVVICMSSNCQPSGHSTVPRRLLDRYRTDVPCPDSIISYNQYMGGVDVGDQLRGYYKCRSKSRKFYKYVIFLLDIAITNAYILGQNYVPTTASKSLKEFRIFLGNELIGDYCNRRRRGRVGGEISSLAVRHFPTKIPDEDGNAKRGKCAYHTRMAARRDCSWFCKECEVWLCHNGKPDDCFQKWHSQ